VAACSPLCAGRSGTTAAGSVNITIELTGATPAAQAAPAIYGGGVVNAANFMVNTLPGGGIAQGSIFTIFGSGLGPANYVQVSSFPLGPQFNGVSINLKQGSQQISGIPLFVYATQINALLPSNTPLGTVSLQVVYNGQTSNWVPVQVVAHAPAVFTATGTGMGWAIFRTTYPPPVSRSTPASPRPRRDKSAPSGSPAAAPSPAPMATRLRSATCPSRSKSSSAAFRFQQRASSTPAAP